MLFIAALIAVTMPFASAEEASEIQQGLIVETELSAEEQLGPPDAPAPAQPPLRPVKKLAPIVIKPQARKPVVPERTPPPPPPEPRFDASASPALSFAYPDAGANLNEGGQTIVWNTSGAIAQVRLSYDGARTPLGGKGRGTFGSAIAKVGNTGMYVWEAPWVDGPKVKLRLVGYGEDGKQLAATEAEYQFLPMICHDKPDTCIVVSKSRQRLWYLREGQIRRMHVVSTAASGFTTPRMKPGSYDRRRGAMGRVFRKAYAPTSRMYDVVMYYWLQVTSSGSHGIHATSPRYYRLLGRPASHGCIRQHRADAKALYDLVSVGTPVYVQ